MTEKRADESRRDAYKLWFDLTILALTHLFLLPLLVFLSILIPLLIVLGDRGPVFYKQKRVGKDGKVFTILKFRTMVKDADKCGPAWTTDGDPRVTTVGKLLRRTALDELPELVSVLKRDMSLVGPRALHVEEQEELEKQIPGFEQRLTILPGLTGLAQVYNRSDHTHGKLHLDLEYLGRMGPWLDLRLLFFSVLNTMSARWDQRGGKVLIPVAKRDLASWPEPSNPTSSMGKGH